MRTAKCARCQARMTVPDQASEFTCPECGAALRPEPRPDGGPHAPDRPSAQPPPPAPSNPPALWHYSDGQKGTQGPLTRKQMRALVDSGTVDADTMVWREGMANWKQLNVTELSGLVVEPVPPVSSGEIPPPLAGSVPPPAPAPPPQVAGSVPPRAPAPPPQVAGPVPPPAPAPPPQAERPVGEAAGPLLDAAGPSEVEEDQDRDRDGSRAARHGVKRNWFVIGGGCAVCLGFFWPPAGVGPLKVSRMDIVNLVFEFRAADKIVLLLVLVPLLGAAAVAIEAAFDGRQRLWAGLAGSASLLVFVGLLALGLLRGRSDPQDVGELRYLLQVGTILCVGGSITILIPCISAFQGQRRGPRRRR